MVVRMGADGLQGTSMGLQDGGYGMGRCVNGGQTRVGDRDTSVLYMIFGASSYLIAFLVCSSVRAISLTAADSHLDQRPSDIL